MDDIEKAIKLKDACTTIYESNFLSIDDKIRILCIIKSNIAEIECYKNDKCACTFSYVYCSDYDEKYNEMKTDIMCCYRKDANVSINGSDITRNEQGSDCIFNELDQYVHILLFNLYKEKNMTSKGIKVKVYKRKKDGTGSNTK